MVEKKKPIEEYSCASPTPLTTVDSSHPRASIVLQRCCVVARGVCGFVKEKESSPQDRTGRGNGADLD